MLLEPVLDYNISSADSNTSISNDDQKYWSKECSKEYSCITDETAKVRETVMVEDMHVHDNSQVTACVGLCDVVIWIDRDRDDHRNKRNSCIWKI